MKNTRKLTVQQALDFATVTAIKGDKRVALTRAINSLKVLAREVQRLKAIGECCSCATDQEGGPNSATICRFCAAEETAQQVAEAMKGGDQNECS